MKVIIVGAGTVGLSLAEHLLGQDYQITIIDHNVSMCERIKSKLDAYVVVGLGSSPRVLEKGGIKNADMVIAVTPNVEVNLLACHFAMQKGVKKRIARVKSDVYTGTDEISLETLGITSVIEPETEVVDKIMQYIELPNVSETANFQANSIYLRGYRITNDMPIVNKTLLEVTSLLKGAPLLVVAITRAGRSLHPSGNQKILEGDDIVVILPKESMPAFRSMINRKKQTLKKIIVAGDSLTALRLAQRLKKVCDNIILVDHDREHGVLASSVLDGVDIFHGNCTNSEVFNELKIDTADCFVAAGNETEDNIMSALLAKSLGCKMVLAVRNDEHYAGLFNSIGIDYIINSSDVTLNMIIEKIQMVPIGSYLTLKSSELNVVRFKIASKSALVDAELQSLCTFAERSIILGCIVREDQVIIPRGNTVIHNGDEAILLCPSEHMQWLKNQCDPRQGFVSGLLGRMKETRE